MIRRSTPGDRADDYGYYFYLHKCRLLECLIEGLRGIY